MKAYLVKEDGSREEYGNVTYFSAVKIVCAAGKGKMTVFAGEGEYFTKSEKGD